MSKASKRRKREQRQRKKRGPAPVLAVCLAAVLCCWGGLASVDRRIRAVTINQSPPLWQVRQDLDQEGDAVWELTILGRRTTVDLSPMQEAGRELSLILRTPPAPMRLALAAFQWAQTWAG